MALFESILILIIAIFFLCTLFAYVKSRMVAAGYKRRTIKTEQLKVIVMSIILILLFILIFRILGV